MAVVKQRAVVISILHFDGDISGTTFRRIPTVCRHEFEREKSAGFAVELFDEHQLRIFNPIHPRYDIDAEVSVLAQMVGLDRVRAHVCVLSGVQRDARPKRRALGDLDGAIGAREHRWVVVYVQHFHLDVKELKLLGGHERDVKSDYAPRVALADAFAVDALLHRQPPVAFPESDEGAGGGAHELKPDSGESPARFVRGPGYIAG